MRILTDSPWFWSILAATTLGCASSGMSADPGSPVATDSDAAGSIPSNAGGDASPSFPNVDAQGVGSTTAEASSNSSDAASRVVDSGSIGVDAGDPASCAAAPVTSLHYAAGADGTGAAGALGFNLADVSSVGDVNALPSGVLALVWLGLCNGADSTFVSTVQPFVGNAKVYGFYLMDEPDPTGQYAPLCPAANLKDESDWIHANAPGTKTFIVLMNLGSDDAPSFDNTYNPSNSDIDLYGLDPYPCQVAFSSCHDAEIAASVTAATSWGIPLAAIVPVYQVFGGGGYAQWQLPTIADEVSILAAWAPVTPSPVFDYAYAWGSQQGDTALGQTPDLQQVFSAHNAGACGLGDGG